MIIRGFLQFNRAINALPLHWKLWTWSQVAVNLIAPLFFITMVEAQAAVAVFCINLVLLSIITAKTGFSRLIGMGHTPWVPLCIFIATRLSQHTDQPAAHAWMIALLVINGASYTIDLVDGVRYLRGERADRAPDLAAS